MNYMTCPAYASIVLFAADAQQTCKVSQDNEFTTSQVQITITFYGFTSGMITEGSRFYFYGFQYASSCSIGKPNANSPVGLGSSATFFQPSWATPQSCTDATANKGWFFIPVATGLASSFVGGDLVLTLMPPQTAQIKTLPNITIVDATGTNVLYTMNCYGDVTKGSQSAGVFSGPAGE